MEVKLLRVVQRYQILMLAVHKQIKLKEAAKQLGLSLRHTKRLARGDFTSDSALPIGVRKADLTLALSLQGRGNNLPPISTTEVITLGITP